MKDQIRYWAHMLDESSHVSYIEGGQRTCALVSNLPDKFVI